mmetsp:Transcript_4561/g.15138  ORF Transcript_4561/g.15138 Transcript_4561/m.15138 type:complete len:428 (+) Transcript_4561:308-1591(+)
MHAHRRSLRLSTMVKNDFVSSSPAGARELVQLQYCLALLLGELLGDLHDHLDELVAPHVRVVDPWHALALNPQHRARLRAGRELHLHLPVRSGHLDAAAEDGVDVGHGEVRVDIDALAPELLVLLDGDEHVEVARLAALWRRVALVAHAEPLPRVDALGDVHLEGLGLVHHAPAVAGAAVGLHLLARAPARGACCLLLHAPEDGGHHLGHNAGAAAGAAGGHLGAGLVARAVAGGARLQVVDADGPLPAEDRGFEVDLEVKAQILALGWAPRPPPAAHAAHAAHAPAAEEALKDVSEVKVHARPAAAHAAALHAGLPKLVVPRAHLRVREHLVRLAHLLELLLGRVRGVHVRVVLARHLAVRGLDLLLVRVAPNAEYRVVIGGHADDTRARAGRLGGRGQRACPLMRPLCEVGAAPDVRHAEAIGQA